MMRCEIAFANDLGRLIELHHYEIKDLTISEFLSVEIQHFDNTKKIFFSVYADGIKIPVDHWSFFNLNKTKLLKIIIEPAGDPFTWIAIIVTIAAAAYSAYLMHKLSAKTASAGTGRTGNSIYDVNAQGNQVKLNEVIPEQFGTIKRFPDYIADTHRYYEDNKRILDLSLCQGVGEFQHSEVGSDMYIGSTPFNLMSEKIKFKVFEPSETLAENDIDPKLGWCWFNSSEISASGKELDTPRQNTHENELVWVWSDFFAVMDTETRKFKNKGWKVGDILKIEAPQKPVLFADSMRYRNCEWVYMKAPEPTNYTSDEVKAPLNNLSDDRTYYLFKGGHVSSFGLISESAAQDPEHSRYGLLGDHYNIATGNYFASYDNNAFCNVWGFGHINNGIGSHSRLGSYLYLEKLLFPLDNSEWASSPMFHALWNQIVSGGSTREITTHMSYGLFYIHHSDTYTYYSELYQPKNDFFFKGTLAVWDYRPSYVYPGTISQFWNRDATGTNSGARIAALKESWLSNPFDTSVNYYNKIGLVCGEALPFMQLPYSYQHYPDVWRSEYFYYCFCMKQEIDLEDRESGYYRITAIKEYTFTGQNGNNYWGSYEYWPEDHPKAYFYKVKKCDDRGTIDALWKAFLNCYTCVLGDDTSEIVGREEKITEGFKVSVFDHVE